MPPRRRSRFTVTLDPRTETIPVEALMCRSMNHPWTLVPLSPSRRSELTRLGQTEFLWYCARCHSRRTELYALPHFDVLHRHIEYSEDYLLKEKGTGRLPRVEAKKAIFLRDLPPSLVTVEAAVLPASVAG